MAQIWIGADMQGAVGDALHALSCAAGYNIRWLLRAIARLGLGGLFCALSAVVAYAVGLLTTMLSVTKALTPTIAGGRGAAIPSGRASQTLRG